MLLMLEGEAGFCEQPLEMVAREVITLLLHVPQPLLRELARCPFLFSANTEPQAIAELEVGAAPNVLSEHQTTMTLEGGSARGPEVHHHTARFEYAVQFGQYFLGVHHVLEDHVGDDCIERSVFERQAHRGACVKFHVFDDRADVDSGYVDPITPSPIDTRCITAAEVEHLVALLPEPNRFKYEAPVDMKAELVIPRSNPHS
jgi:hypothetical protein